MRRYPMQEIRFNPGQLEYIYNFSKDSTLICPRGWGKTFIIAWLMHMVIKHMPRSTWGMVGATYANMLETTILPVKYALGLMGYIEDTHYYIRQKPPEKANFDKPLKPPNKFDYTWIWYTGNVFQLISQDRNARGSDLQGIICDEALRLKKQRYDEEISPGIRGFLQDFGHLPFYRGEYFFSSMPDVTQGKWLLDHAEYYQQDGYDFDVLQKKLIRLQLEYIDNSDNKIRNEIMPAITDLRKRVKFYRKLEYDINKKPFYRYYKEGNCFDNIDNIGLTYLQDRRRKMMDVAFRIEILNEKMPAVMNGFYCNLNEDVHLYDQYDYSFIDNLGFDKLKFENKDCRFDSDVDKHRHLHLGIDLGIHINVGCVAQYNHTEIRFLKDFYAKSPLLLKDMVKEFVTYYAPHPKKLVKVSFDTSSSSQQQYDSNKTLISKVKDELQKHGWTVEILTSGRKLSHQERYDLINEMYMGSYKSTDQRKYPLLYYHRYNCHNLILSLGCTEVRKGRTGFEKDKSGERNMSADQLRQPHLTDAHDYLISDLLKDLYKSKNMAGLGELHT